MNNLKLIGFVLACSIAVVGCRSTSRIPTSDTSGGDFGDGSGSGITTQSLGGGNGIGITAEEAERQRLMQNIVVYFDFDRSDIRPEFNEMLAAHGAYLRANPTASVRLEGHADETGSREYNIGLGERRAQAVRTVLLLQGAAATQLSTVSYGEERPAVLGSDEEAYRLNRRVELVYR